MPSKPPSTLQDQSKQVNPLVDLDNDRKRLVEAASTFAVTLERDNQRKPVKVRTPAHGCKCAHVSIERVNNSFIRVSCQCIPDNPEADTFPCPSLSLCYHSLAALQHAAREKKLTLCIHKSPFPNTITVSNGKTKMYVSYERSGK